MSGQNHSFADRNDTCPDGSECSQESQLKSVIVLEVLVMVFGIIGNICLFCLMRRKRFSQETFAIYLSFSAVFDSWFLFSHGLMDALETFQRFSLSDYAAENFACIVDYILITLASIIVVWLIVVLALDRFLSICYPEKGRWYCIRSKAIIVSAIVVVVGLVITISFALFERTSVTEVHGIKHYQCRSTLPNPEDGSIVLYLLMNLLPLAIMTILNLKIFLKLRKSGGYAFVSEDRVILTSEKAKTERMNGIVFYALVMNIVTMLPLCIVEMIYIPYETYGNITPEREEVLSKAWHITLMIFMITFAQNFYIMMAFSKMFRSEFVSMIQSTFCCKTLKEDSYENVNLSEHDHENVQELQNQMIPEQDIQ